MKLHSITGFSSGIKGLQWLIAVLFVIRIITVANYILIVTNNLRRKVCI
jgi:hypothetical protein